MLRRAISRRTKSPADRGVGDDPDRRVVALELGDHLEAVHPRHQEVEDDGVDRVALHTSSTSKPSAASPTTAMSWWRSPRRSSSRTSGSSSATSTRRSADDCAQPLQGSMVTSSLRLLRALEVQVAVVLPRQRTGDR